VLCIKIIIVKSKDLKTGWSYSKTNIGRIFYGRLWFKKCCFANDDDILCLLYLNSYIASLLLMMSHYTVFREKIVSDLVDIIVGYFVTVSLGRLYLVEW
jgi:hypothetical protein